MKRVVFNQKGGVGKSSISCNLAAVSASMGKRTLVVDVDVQGNSSHYLGVDIHDPEREAMGSVADLLKQSAGGWFSARKRAADYVQETEFDNLFLLAADVSLASIERDLESRYKIYKLRDALDELTESFDEIYIDTPPNLNFYSKSALIAADCVLIPFDCDSFSRRALYNLLENMMELREDHNPKLELQGIVVNQFNSQARLPAELIQELRDEELPVLDSYLSSSIKMKESHSAQRPMVYYAPSHKLTAQLRELWQEIQ